MECENSRSNERRGHRPIANMDLCPDNEAIYSVCLVGDRHSQFVYLCKTCESRLREKQRWRNLRVNTRLLPADYSANR